MCVVQPCIRPRARPVSKWRVSYVPPPPCQRSPRSQQPPETVQPAPLLVSHPANNRNPLVRITDQVLFCYVKRSRNVEKFVDQRGTRWGFFFVNSSDFGCKSWIYSFQGVVDPHHFNADPDLESSFSIQSGSGAGRCFSLQCGSGFSSSAKWWESATTGTGLQFLHGSILSLQLSFGNVNGSTALFLTSKALIFDINSDSDPAFHSYADPNLASKNNADP